MIRESGSSGNDPGNNQGGVTWDPANKKYNYLVRDQALYNNPELRDSARLAARYCIDHNPNYVPYQPGMDIRMNASAGFVESRFKVQNKDYALLFDQVNCYYRVPPFAGGTSAAPSASTSGSSAMPGPSDDILLITSQLGWINCDRWISSNLPLVTAKLDGTGKNCFYYLIFEDIQSIMPGYTDCESGQITFPNVPRGQKAQLIAIKIENGLYSMGMKNIRCENELYTLEMKEMPKEEIRQMLSGDAWDLEARN